MSSKGSLILLALIVGFLVGYFSQPKPIVEYVTTTKDSIRYSLPQNVHVKTTEIKTFTIPRLVFAPAQRDTVIIVDSVRVELPFERREYRDSTYKAVVSGVVVGDVRPTLESLDIYTSTTTKTIVEKPRLFTPYASVSVSGTFVGIGGGVTIRAKHGIGIEYIGLQDGGKLALKYTYYFK